MHLNDAIWLHCRHRKYQNYKTANCILNFSCSQHQTHVLQHQMYHLIFGYFIQYVQT